MSEEYDDLSITLIGNIRKYEPIRVSEIAHTPTEVPLYKIFVKKDNEYVPVQEENLLHVDFLEKWKTLDIFLPFYKRSCPEISSLKSTDFVFYLREDSDKYLRKLKRQHELMPYKKIVMLSIGSIFGFIIGDVISEYIHKV